jgi:hypothetical protein
MPTFDYEFFSLYAPEGWADVTESLEIDNSPITLALPEGVGALQLSVAGYIRGEKPDPRPGQLAEMLKEFGQSRGLGPPNQVTMQAGRISKAAGSFSDDGDFVRVWYLTDGLHFAMVTYVCEMGCESLELDTCEHIVSSLEFAPRA